VSKLPLVSPEYMRLPAIPEPIKLSYLLTASNDSTLCTLAGDST
jgi:hypothetical protein